MTATMTPTLRGLALVAGVAAVVTSSPIPAVGQLNNGRIARPDVDLPNSAVRHVILKSCTTCHGIDDYAYHALDRAGWHALVETMKEKGAVVADEDQATLLDWLVSEFGPDSTPFPRESVITPVAGSLFRDDAAAREYLVTTCGSCHALDRVETARFSETRWHAVVTDMKTRGAAVADENVEDLVAYLSRTHGTTP